MSMEMDARREMSRAMLRRWRPRIEKRTSERLWGQRRFIFPRLVPFVWGDGMQWIYLSPINSRPAYYVVRIDSRVDLSNHAPANCFYDVCLDDVLEAISDYFGERYAEDTPVRWPELDWTIGGEWGPYKPPRKRR